MTWKVEGLIAAHFPNKTVANFDTTEIYYGDKNAQNVNDLKPISAVYYITASDRNKVNAVNVDQYRIWSRTWEEEGASYVLDEENYCPVVRIKERTNKKVNHFELTVNKPKDGSIGIFAILDENGAILHRNSTKITMVESDKVEGAYTAIYDIPENFTFKAYSVYYIVFQPNEHENENNPTRVYYIDETNPVGKYVVLENQQERNNIIGQNNLPNDKPYVYVSTFDAFNEAVNSANYNTHYVVIDSKEGWKDKVPDYFWGTNLTTGRVYRFDKPLNYKESRPDSPQMGDWYIENGSYHLYNGNAWVDGVWLQYQGYLTDVGAVSLLRSKPVKSRTYTLTY